MSKFKVGQLVRCINKGTKGSGWKLGEEFIIKEITDTSDGHVYWPKEVHAHGVYENSLKLIESDWDE